MRRIILSMLLMVMGLFILSSCAASMFEEEITVKFMCEDEIIGEGVVTQFKNIKTPKLADAYIFDGYKFFGWTALSNVKATDSNFKEEYIGDGKMVHYMDVKQYAKNHEVVLQALLIDKEDIPKIYHYVVLAWYDKTGTSGITSAQIETLQNALNTYLKENGYLDEFVNALKAEGVSDENIVPIVIRGYTGNVGPSCGDIMSDGDVDLMLGWGSKDNVTGTGGMPEEMILETVTFKVTYEGTSKSRTIHRLSDADTVKVVMAWLQTEEVSQIFN